MIAKNSPDAPVIVIGAGLAGLAAACTLAGRGMNVTLIEANDHLGGKAKVLREGGYRFDMGPTILTLPDMLKRIWTEAGRTLADDVELIRLDPQWRCLFTDGAVLDLRENLADMRKALDAFAPGSADGYERFMSLSERLHSISERFFFDRPIGSIRDMMDPKATFNLSTLSDVLAMRMGRTVAGTIRSMTPDARLAQMLDHFTQYVGSAPDQSPAVLCSIAHMQTDGGVWYPMGGTGAVPAALRKLAGDLGVNIRTGAEARRIIVENGRAVGVELSGGEVLQASAVISNADAVRTHRELLGGAPAKRFERRRTYEPACSGVVLYLGLDRRYQQLLHHNFVFSADPHAEFDAIYRQGVPAPDPTCYVCAPAITEPAVAPPGGEALYVLVHTPYLRPGQDWSVMLPKYRETILDKLAATAGMSDLREHIVVERHLTPRDIHDRYRVLDGAIYGLASHGRFLGAFKPSNRSPDVAGLYLAGGAAHPGAGMPMVLMSGWIAADALTGDLAKT